MIAWWRSRSAGQAALLTATSGMALAAWSATASVTLLVGSRIGLAGHSILTTWWQYVWAYGFAYPQLNRWLAISGAAGAIPALLLLAGLSRERRWNGDLYGRATFATLADLRKNGYLASALEQVIWLGRRGRRFLRLGGQAHIAVIAPTGAGKAQPDTAKVLTPTGFRMIGELRVGDHVTCPDGKVVPILGVFPQGQKEIFCVTFEDGRSVECCADHLWKVWRHDKTHLPKWRSLKLAGQRYFSTGADWRILDLRTVKRWFDNGVRKSKRAAVPLIDAFAAEYPPQELPIPPYLLGALIGDGSIGYHLGFTSADEHVLERVRNDSVGYDVIPVPDGGRGIHYRLALSRSRERKSYTDEIGVSVRLAGVPGVRHGARGGIVIPWKDQSLTIKDWSDKLGIPVPSINVRLRRGWTIGQSLGFEPRRDARHDKSQIAAALRQLGLFGCRSHEKFIPDIYKRGSVGQRLALLQGLMDTDGSADKAHASFTSTSNQLVRDVQEIAWSLGAIASISERQTFYTYNGERKPGRKSWRVAIVHPDVSIMFSLPRKLARHKPKTMQHRLRIKSIEPAGIAYCRCISIDHPEGLYTTDNYVVTHNTVSFIVPNAILWRGSLVALDMKKELWAKSAGARARAGQRVYMFDPLEESGCTARWNPLAYVTRSSVDTFSDIARIFEMLFPENAGASDPFWMNAPRLAATGVAAFISETPDLPFTMGEVARTFTRPDIRDYLTKTIEERQRSGGGYSQPTVSAVHAYLKNATATFDSITSTVISRLQLWLDPRVDAATAENDFDLRELRHKLFAVYVGVTRESLALLRPVLSLFFQQVVDVNSRATFEDDPDARHRLLLLLDEFANLDRMKVLSSAFSLVRGYGMRIMLVLQSRAQLPALYGEAEARAILSNCDCKVWFRPDDTNELKDLSERLGYNTVESVSYSRPRMWLAGHGGQRRGETVSSQRRALRLPQEIARMGEDEVLILHTGMPAVIAKRLLYYKDRLFRGLVCPPPLVKPIKVELKPAQPVMIERPKSPEPARQPPAPPAPNPQPKPVPLPPVPPKSEANIDAKKKDARTAEVLISDIIGRPPLAGIKAAKTQEGRVQEAQKLADDICDKLKKRSRRTAKA